MKFEIHLYLVHSVQFINLRDAKLTKMESLQKKRDTTIFFNHSILRNKRECEQRKST